MGWENFDGFSSSNIARLRYDSSNMILEVGFHNGGVYHYYDVPSQVWEDFKAASSKGSYLHNNIKGSYRYSKV